MNLILAVITLVLSFIGAMLAGPLVINLYESLGWIDDPEKKKGKDTTVHTVPVPRGGGLVVASGLILVGCLLFPWSTAVKGIFAGAMILLVTGTLDDHYDIDPYLRYFFNILAGLVVIFSGVGIEYITNPFGDGVLFLNQWTVSFSLIGKQLEFSLLADSFALLWIVWNMNAVNWSKGVAGQLPGFVSIAAIFIALLSLRFQGDITQGVVTLLALGVSGAYLGLLVWNIHPQKMMPGYAGGSLAGYFLSVLAILSGAKVATVLLLLAIPTADALFTVTRRLAAGRSPFWGDRGHLHHRMLDAGWSVPQIATFYWGATLIFGLIALQLNSEAKLYALIASAILFLALLLWFKRSITSSKPLDPDNGSKM